MPDHDTGRREAKADCKQRALKDRILHEARQADRFIQQRRTHALTGIGLGRLPLSGRHGFDSKSRAGPHAARRRSFAHRSNWL